MIKRVHIRITGRVQEIGFRFAAITTALELGGIVGRIRYGQKDEVIIDIQGETDILKSFMRWAKVGPPGAIIHTFHYESFDNLEDWTEFSAEAVKAYKGDEN